MATLLLADHNLPYAQSHEDTQQSLPQPPSTPQLKLHQASHNNRPAVQQIRHAPKRQGPERNGQRRGDTRLGQNKGLIQRTAASRAATTSAYFAMAAFSASSALALASAASFASSAMQMQGNQNVLSPCAQLRPVACVFACIKICTCARLNSNPS